MSSGQGRERSKDQRAVGEYGMGRIPESLAKNWKKRMGPEGLKDNEFETLRVFLQTFNMVGKTGLQAVENDGKRNP
jgi:hypothetical protein